MSKAATSGLTPRLHYDKIREAIEVWSPTYPRRAGRYQTDVNTAEEVVNVMAKAHRKEPGYISVYSFPRGHSSDGEIPQVDTLMLDFDLPGEVYNGDGNKALWRVEMEGLLATVRLVAHYLIEEGVAENWRFSLSGHKGIHLYLDFPVVHPAHGTLQQFKRGLSEYTDNLIDHLETATGTDLRPWLDVDSSDMGRLTRLPNTLHTGATEAFGEDRYCVPVTAEELVDLDPERYEELVSQPRHLPDEIRRVPSERASMRIAMHVQLAHGGNATNGSKSVGNLDREKITQILAEYDEKTANPAYSSVDDLWLFMEDRPCVRAFYERDDQFEYGNQSHVMELFVLTRLVNMEVPSDVVLEFFEGMTGYNEWDTKEQLAQVVVRDYSDFNCEKLWFDAERFCLGNRCNIYERSH